MSTATTHPLVSVFGYYGSLVLDELPDKPWRWRDKHGTWLWATQGHLFVGLRGDGDADPTPERFQKAARYFVPTVETVQRMTLPWASLTAFAGEAPSADITCERCHGTGRNEFDEGTICDNCGHVTYPECHDCGGDGKGSLPKRYAEFWADAPFNRSYLAFALSVVEPVAEVSVGVMPTGKAKEQQALLVESALWRIVLMGVRDIHTTQITRFVREETADAADRR